MFKIIKRDIFLWLCLEKDGQQFTVTNVRFVTNPEDIQLQLEPILGNFGEGTRSILERNIGLSRFSISLLLEGASYTVVKIENEEEGENLFTYIQRRLGKIEDRLQKQERQFSHPVPPFHRQTQLSKLLDQSVLGDFGRLSRAGVLQRAAALVEADRLLFQRRLVTKEIFTNISIQLKPEPKRHGFIIDLYKVWRKTRLDTNLDTQSILDPIHLALAIQRYWTKISNNESLFDPLIVLSIVSSIFQAKGDRCGHAELKTSVQGHRVTFTLSVPFSEGVETKKDKANFIAVTKFFCLTEGHPLPRTFKSQIKRALSPHLNDIYWALQQFFVKRRNFSLNVHTQPPASSPKNLLIQATTPSETIDQTSAMVRLLKFGVTNSASTFMKKSKGIIRIYRKSTQHLESSAIKRWGRAFATAALLLIVLSCLWTWSRHNGETPTPTSSLGTSKADYRDSEKEQKELSEKRTKPATEKRLKQVKTKKVIPPPSPHVDEQEIPKNTVIPSIDYSMVYIRPGTFTMGSPPSEGGRERDEIQHQVTLTKGFYLGLTEITQKQWRTIMGNNPSLCKNFGEDCPVEKVSWDDCKKFIEKLNQKEGTMEFRLPTEAEWEYACRADTNAPFSFGRCLLTSQANYNGDEPYIDCSKGKNRKSTVPVGSLKAPNAWGLHDMHANLWEWCEDHCEWHEEVVTNTYKDGIKDPLCHKGPKRVIRGGSWKYDASVCRSANRNCCDPDRFSCNIGFRLVRELY